MAVLSRTAMPCCTDAGVSFPTFARAGFFCKAPEVKEPT